MAFDGTGTATKQKGGSPRRSLRPCPRNGASWRAGVGWVRRLAFLSSLRGVLLLSQTCRPVKHLCDHRVFRGPIDQEHFITCSDTVKVLLARITLPCRDVTKLASESMDRTLPLGTRIQLQLHYWICEACAQYRRQLLVLRQAMRHSASESRAEEGAELSPAARARLKDALRARRD